MKTLKIKNAVTGKYIEEYTGREQPFPEDMAYFGRLMLTIWELNLVTAEPAEAVFKHFENEHFVKLTSCDRAASIIEWILYAKDFERGKWVLDAR